MPTESGIWPCDSCGSLVYLHEIVNGRCGECPKVEQKWGTP